MRQPTWGSQLTSRGRYCCDDPCPSPRVCPQSRTCLCCPETGCHLRLRFKLLSVPAHGVEPNRGRDLQARVPGNTFPAFLLTRREQLRVRTPSSPGFQPWGHSGSEAGPSDNLVRVLEPVPQHLKFSALRPWAHRGLRRHNFLSGPPAPRGWTLCPESGHSPGHSYPVPSTKCRERPGPPPGPPAHLLKTRQPRWLISWSERWRL